MKKLILIFAFLVMLCGGTVSALKFLEIGPFEVKGKPKEKKVAAVRRNAAVFVDMDPLAIPIFQGNRVAALVQIQVKLQTSSDKNAKKIRRMMPVINDAFVRDLHGFMPRLLKAEERIDPVIIKQRLQMISDKIAGRGLIEDVQVQSVLER